MLFLCEFFLPLLSNNSPNIQLLSVNMSNYASKFRSERSGDECTNVKKNIDTVKSALDPIDKVKDFKVNVGSKLTKLVEFSTRMTNVFPAVATVAATLGFFSGQQDGNCKLMKKLDEIHNAIKKVSLQVENVEFLIECEGVKSNWRKIAEKISKLNDVIKSGQKSSIRKFCGSPSDGIQDIKSSFEFFIKEDDASKLFKSCAKYESDNIYTWVEKISDIATEIIYIITFCDYANDINRKFDSVKYSKEIKKIVEYASTDLVLKNFKEDTGRFGLIEAVKEYTKNEGIIIIK